MIEVAALAAGRRPSRCYGRTGWMLPEAVSWDAIPVTDTRDSRRLFFRGHDGR